MGRSWLEVDRIQWAMGNGGFHTEDIYEEAVGLPRSGPFLRVVYDCGSLRTEKIRRCEIKTWATASGFSPSGITGLNILVISHFDADHVNGLFLLKRQGFTPQYIVLPYLSPAEKMLQLIRSAAHFAESSGSGNDDNDDNTDTRGFEFSAALTQDPISALGELWPGARIFEQGPTVDNPDRIVWPNRDGSPEDGADSSDDPQHFEVDIFPARGIRVCRNRSSSAPSGSEALWEYLWDVHRVSGYDSSKWLSAFCAALSQDLKITFTGVHQTDTQALWAAISNKGAAAKVAKIYRKLLGTKDLNPFSLLLWSGPSLDNSRVGPIFRYPSRKISDRRRRWVLPRPQSGGWLGTGDAQLVTKADVDLLFSLLDLRVEDVDVLNAPHHGSKHNSSAELYSRVPKLPGVVLMPADGMNGFNHPHDETLRATVFAGHAAVRVGKVPSERFMWRIAVR